MPRPLHINFAFLVRPALEALLHVRVGCHRRDRHPQEAVDSETLAPVPESFGE
jgi:hypothetical protein